MKKGLDAFFHAASVVVVGASPRLETPGGTTAQQLLARGFPGDVYLVNPKYRVIGDRPCYPSVAELPGAVDLAVVAVAARHVLPVLRQCAAKGIKGAIIYTAGFSETGAGEQVLAQEAMQELARTTGLRIMGPNCVGLVNNARDLWATFAQPPLFEEGLRPGGLGIISQSGFFGIAIYQLAAYNGLGFRYFASVGNQADLSFTDFLAYMVEDPQIQVICAYLEGLKASEDLLPVARRALTLHKPLAVIKVGSTEAGSRAAQSHTGALAGREENYAALFKQTAITRAEDFEQLVAYLHVSLMERPPRGRRVGIISVSGGGAVMLADKCGRSGLQVPELQPETRARLEAMLPSFATSGNPLDLTGQALEEPDLFGRALEAMLQGPGIDILLVSYHIHVMLCWMALAKIRECYPQTDKTIITIGTPLGQEEDVRTLIKETRKVGVPVLLDMNYAIWAVRSYADWWDRAREAQETGLPGKGEVPPLAGKEGLPEYESAALLTPYGLSFPRGFLAKTAREAGEAVQRLGGPAVFKVQSPQILHKTEAGGVRLGIATPAAGEQAFEEIMAAARRFDPGAAVVGVLVQEMLPPGQEVIVGMKRDEALGPVIMFGLGGVFVEMLPDVALRVAPLTPRDAREMVEEIKGYKLLAGYRGSPPLDVEAVEKLLLQISHFAVENPTVLELDLNPVFVYPRGEGLKVADALVIRGIPAPDRE
jgi:acetate---CoA ligase (ADP-forming)